MSVSWGTRDEGRTIGEPIFPAPPRCVEDASVGVASGLQSWGDLGLGLGLVGVVEVLTPAE
jgi:hypothetical protein